MAENISKRILDKIRGSDSPVAVKIFLQKMLYFELSHADEPRVRYTDRYDEEIDNCLKNYGDDKNADR